VQLRFQAHERHFVYSTPSSFAGDSGGAIILRGGQASGMHIMTVNQALELQRLRSLDEDEATTGDIVRHVNSVTKESVASLIKSLSSGALGLSVSSVMAAHRSNQELKRRAS
jgi:predicted nucleic acid-binding Zn finger protein